MKTLPKDVALYKTTILFDNLTVPKGLLKNHSTIEKVWGLITVVEGQLIYIIQEQENITRKKYILCKGEFGLIEPKIKHRLELPWKVKFKIDFYKKQA